MRICKLHKNILIFVLASILIVVGKGTFAETTSLKSFTKQIYKNFGPEYTSHVEELFGVLLKPKIVGTSEGSSFLEFDVLKMKVVDNKTLSVRIDNGDVVHNKDKCKISFTPRRDCFLYIFRIETTGVITPLFPRKEFSKLTNPIKANLTYFVPPMKKWLSFKKGYGKESVVIFASIKRNTDIERLMEYFDGHGTLKQLTRQNNVKYVNKIPLINKGIGRVRKSETRRTRLPFDEFGEFTSTEFEWMGPEIVITLLYKRK